MGCNRPISPKSIRLLDAPVMTSCWMGFDTKGTSAPCCKMQYPPVEMSDLFAMKKKNEKKSQKKVYLVKLFKLNQTGRKPFGRCFHFHPSTQEAGDNEHPLSAFRLVFGATSVLQLQMF